MPPDGPSLGRFGQAAEQRSELVARLTVKPSLRPVVGCAQLLRSLGTTDDHSIALHRWPEAYKALEQELQLRIQLSNADQQPSATTMATTQMTY